MAVTRTKRRKTLVVHFASDLLRDEELQQSLIKNPRAAMKRYGLARPQIGILMTQSSQKIMSLMQKELKAAARVIFEANASA
ncbi:MAG: hypothetical protein ACREQQ_11310 [Candidatus Binatia bacterium]